MEEEKQKLLDFLKKDAGRPLSFNELIRSFNVRSDKREAFKRMLKDLVSEGEVIMVSGGRFGVASRLNLVTGELSCHPDGYGFVRPDEGGEDVFIGPRKFAGAMHGDRVAARVEGYKAGGKREGRIVRVIKRAHKTVVGRFERHRGIGIVVPSDPRLLERIIIPPSEAKGAKEGTIVEAEITRWPGNDLSPSGKVVASIGDPESPEVEVEVILRKYGLPSKFPPDVMHEVREVPTEVGHHDIRGRVDLREVTTVTIDGETAKDFDDAVSIEKTAEGYRLHVSIADVSHYVREGSALDREAFSRGTSVYFPDRCIPMLPEALSNGICSLNPNVERLTLTAEMHFNNEGDVIRNKFYESVIRSRERLTYTNVKKVLYSEDDGLLDRYSHIASDLRLMEDLALKLLKRRSMDGSIDFDLPEPQIIIDIEGKVEDIVRSERNIAHRIIEEFMLSANRAVAEEFSRRKAPFIYRVHEPPDEESIENFREFIRGFGLHFKGGAAPKAFQAVLEQAKNKPEEKLINHVLLRSMKQAVYSDKNYGHFGLAFEDYTHFTSPIRRYPDLVVHRLLKKQIHGKYLKPVQDVYEQRLPEIASRTSSTERKAMEAEREITDLKKAQFMADKVGEVFEGFVSGVTSFGVFVELKEYFVESLVHISSLRDDYYIYDGVRHRLEGERTRRSFSIGDPLKVRIDKVDLERRRIDSSLADEAGERVAEGAGRWRGRGRRGVRGRAQVSAGGAGGAIRGAGAKEKTEKGFHKKKGGEGGGVGDEGGRVGRRRGKRRRRRNRR